MRQGGPSVPSGACARALATQRAAHLADWENNAVNVGSSKRDSDLQITGVLYLKYNSGSTKEVSGSSERPNVGHHHPLVTTPSDYFWVDSNSFHFDGIQIVCKSRCSAASPKPLPFLRNFRVARSVGNPYRRQNPR